MLTWGRIFDRIDPKPLLDAIENNLTKYGISNVSKITLCESLQDAAAHKFFYETFFLMAQKLIPFGKKKYPKWRAQIKKRILKGEEIYWLR
ncbi:MAG: hypothetical protein IPK56_00060 [Elusimicrobia bacterium]|nr:hypothetical protein [Elusimicrobiota bacterium]